MRFIRAHWLLWLGIAAFSLLLFVILITLPIPVFDSSSTIQEINRKLLPVVISTFISLLAGFFSSILFVISIAARIFDAVKNTPKNHGPSEALGNN
jgi:hypothetical protein